MGGVDRMIKGHLKIALNIGISEAQINDKLNVIEIEGDRKKVGLCRNIFNEILAENQE